MPPAKNKFPLHAHPRWFRAVRNLDIVAPYSPRARGYCDGAAPERHVGQLTLTSATVGIVRFTNGILPVAVESPHTFRIRGWDLRENPVYRLDGVLHDGRLDIDLNAAIVPLDMQQHQIGLYAWRWEGQTKVYAPVWLTEPLDLLLKFYSPDTIVEVRTVAFCAVENELHCLTQCTTTSLKKHDDVSLILRSKLPEEAGRFRLAIHARDSRGQPVVGTFLLDIPEHKK